MRIASVLVLLVVAVGCASTPDTAFECSEPRPQVCTMEFAPTCARLSGGDRKEFASPCTACADPGVSGYDKGGCQE